MAEYKREDVVFTPNVDYLDRRCVYCSSRIIDTTFVRMSDHTSECKLQRVAINDMEETVMKVSYDDYNDRMDRIDTKLDVLLDRIVELVTAINEAQDEISQTNDAIDALDSRIAQLEDALMHDTMRALDVEDYV